MTIRIIALLCAMAIVTPALAQTTAPAAAPKESKFVGTVNAVDVYVRSGPGSAYACTKISSPTKVTVVDRDHDWLKILPPPGTFSIVSKQFLTVDEANQIGTVNADNVFVRPAGDLKSGEKVADYTAIQGMLNKGARVKVIGQGSDFYKIVPPAGAGFWIADRYVTPEGGTPVARTGTATTRPDANSVVGGTVVVATGSVRTTRTTMPAASNDEIAAREAWNVAEGFLTAEYAKPLGSQDLEALLAKYKEIKVTKNSPLKPYVDYRIEFLQTNRSQEDRRGRRRPHQAHAADAGGDGPGPGERPHEGSRQPARAHLRRPRRVAG